MGSSMIVEFVFVYGGIGELCFVKVVWYGDCGVEVGEKVEFVNNGFYVNFKFGRDVGCFGLFEGVVVDGNNF